MSTQQAIAIVCVLLGSAGGFVGGVLAFDAKIDAKIDRAVAPINRQIDQMADDVRGIRQLLEQLLLEDRQGRR
jgi:hypothetical protein